MTHEELLLKEGAAYFGNRMIYRNKDVGVTAPGTSLVLTAEGEAVVANLLSITDVVVKEKKPRAKKEEPVVVADDPDDFPEFE